MAYPLSQSIVTCKAVKAHSGHLLYYHTSRDDGVLRISQVYSRSYNALYELFKFIYFKLLLFPFSETALLHITVQ